MTDDLTTLLKEVGALRSSMETQAKDMAEIRGAVAGTKINGTVISKGILARLDRLEKGFVALGALLVTVLGITGGSTVIDWFRSL